MDDGAELKPIRLKFEEEPIRTDEKTDHEMTQVADSIPILPPPELAKPPSSSAPNISLPADAAATPPHAYPALLAQYKTEMGTLRARVQTTINQRQASRYFPMTLFSDSIMEALIAQRQALDNLLKIDDVQQMCDGAIDPDIVPVKALDITSDVTRWLEKMRPGSTEERKQSPEQNYGCS